MKKIVKNLTRVDNFINKLSKNTSTRTSKWLKNNFKNYLLNEYDNFKIIEKNKESQTIHIVLSKKLKEEVNIVIDYLENSKHNQFDSSQVSFEQILKFKDKNIVAVFSNDSYLSDVVDSKEIKELKSEFKFSLYNNIKVWKLVDKFDHVLAIIKYSYNSDNFFIVTNSNKSSQNLVIDEICFKEIPSKSLQHFFEWSQQKFDVNFYTNIFSNPCLNKNTGLKHPISIWDENGLLEEDLYINDDIEYLPKNLTVKGNIYMENSTLSFLGNGLKVKGNIYADNSQLAVIDDTVEVDGKIHTEDSLLVSYPNSLSNKIVNPKKIRQIIREF